MVSNMHRLLLREGRNNRSNSDFQTFFEEFISTDVLLSMTLLGKFDIALLKSMPFVFRTFKDSLFTTISFMYVKQNQIRVKWIPSTAILSLSIQYDPLTCTIIKALAAKGHNERMYNKTSTVTNERSTEIYKNIHKYTLNVDGRNKTSCGFQPTPYMYKH